MTTTLASRSTRSSIIDRPRRIVVIINPSTHVEGATIASAVAEWRPGNDEIRLFTTTLTISAYQIAKRERDNADIIVAAGGDGTVGEVATAIARTSVLLGIIPAGSTNIVARDLGIPRSPSAAMDLITSDSFDVAALDIGWVGEHALVHMAGAGFDSRLFATANPRLKRRYGWLAYLVSGLRALFAKPSHFLFQIEADGERFQVESPLVLGANGGTLATPRWRLHPAPRRDDGVLDLLIITAKRPTQIAATLGRALLGQLDRTPYVMHRPVKQVRIETDQPLPVQVNGDVLTTTPVTITVDPAALRVIVPQGARSS
jgi:YegS/Rv2252/BmrU family lipid kinase